MKMYSVIESECLNDKFPKNRHSILELTMKRYLKMKRIAKTHRGVSYNKNDIRDIQRECAIDLTVDDNDNDETQFVKNLVSKMNSM